MPTKFGQIVIGPPGSGKTTYCRDMSKLLRDSGRKLEIINLDPANDDLPYVPSIDINKLITVDQVMQNTGMGPNGALVHVMEYLGDHMEWLMKKIRQSPSDYFIIDFPGQVELYSHHTMVKDIVGAFTKADLRTCSVFMIDSHYASDPGKYISALLVTLNSMLNLECPTVNVLSKMDTINTYGQLGFGLEFYTDVMDLDYLLDLLDDDPLTKKYKKLSKALADVISSYGLVGFIPMSIDNKDSMQNVSKAVDKANGYIFGVGEHRATMRELANTAMGAETEHDRIGLYKDSMADSDEESVDSEEEYLRMITNPRVQKSVS